MSGNRDRMKKAIEENAGKGPAKASPLPIKWQPMVAAAAKKQNPRSSVARDARSKARGRLPTGTIFHAEWNGKTWSGSVKVYWPNENLAHRITHEADGLFRLLEELDVMFWEWVATYPAIHELPWPSEDVKPETYPKENR